MARVPHPDEIGTLWINEGQGKNAGKQFLNGKAFPVPDDGMLIRLVPFSFQNRMTKEVVRGYNVLIVAEGD